MKLIFCIASLILGISFSQSQTIYHHAKIYTVDEAFNIAESFAVKDGKIEGVGSLTQLKAQFPSYSLIDLKGKYIYPGFIDAHCHFLGLGLSKQMVDLKGTKSMDEVIQRCVAFDKKFPSSILFGRGWDQNDWVDKSFPTNEQLNKLFPNKIVILKRIDGHAALCNDFVLNLAKITCSLKVDGGEIICRNNKPSGVLIDNAVDLVMTNVTALDENYIYQSLKLAQTECLSYGLTTVVDAGLELDTLQKIQHIYDQNLLKIRFSGMYAASEKCLKYIKQNSNSLSKTNKQLFSVNGIKIYADGALGSRGACLKQPYSDRENHYGFLLTPLKQINEIAALAMQKNLQMNVHCIGDSASFIVMNVMGKYLKGINDKRWRIEHAQVIGSSDFDMFKKFSILPSVQPTHATSDMPWAENRLGSKRISNAYAYKKLLNQNGYIALGTDFPVEDVSTFKTFYASCIRKDSDGNPNDGFQIENALTREETIKGMTIWAAKSIFEEHSRGSIEKGKSADFIVLDQDLMQVKESKILSTQVLATYINGEKVFEKK